MPSRHSEGFAVLLAATLIVGLFSLRLLPVYQPLWGLDFQNVYAYQTCSQVADEGLYETSGLTCDDEMGRSFVYPPTLFYMFSWASWFTFDTAIMIWNVATVLTMLGVGGVWLWLDRHTTRGWRRVALVVFWLALMVQFPFVFALERGNNDIIPVALWTAATTLLIWRRDWLAGGLAGLAVATKVYPAIAVAVTGLGLLRTKWTSIIRLGIGGLGVVALSTVLWWDDMIQYTTEVLPSFIARSPDAYVYSHTLSALALPPVVTTGLALALFSSWALLAWRRIDDTPLLVLAGALAISTYFSSTSWDYNLITTYPLLLLVTARALAPDSRFQWKAASFTALLVIVAGRGLFTPTGQVLAQVLTLIGIAWLILGSESSSTPGRSSMKLPNDSLVSDPPVRDNNQYSESSRRPLLE